MPGLVAWFVWPFPAAALICTPGSQTQPPPAQAPQEPAAPKPQLSRVEYASHVVIDWRFPLVELDARVVLRAGPLELLACSPGTREHESILQVPARPRHIFEALGLIGLTPGSPVRYDADQDAWVAPTGDALMLRILSDFPFGEVSIPAEAWLTRLSNKDRSVETIPWVFAGSDRLKDGSFGADAEGTVVCVVDFGSALITVGEAHTADDAALWLGAEPKFIPKEGSRCRLLVSGRPAPALVIDVAADGQLRHGDKPITPQQVIDLWRGPPDATSDPRPAAPEPKPPPPGGRLRILELALRERSTPQAVRKVVESLTSGGIPSSALLLDPRRGL